jgi:FixJ family two-component response regulator
MPSRAMGLADGVPFMTGANLDRGGASPDVAVLEDDAHLAELAVELCDRLGLSAATYRSPAGFLGEVSHNSPRVLILDWRFERELGAAVFMAVRHRLGDLPIVCWTSTTITDLPTMLVRDPAVRIVQKSRGVEAFESALRWAMQNPAEPRRLDH